MLKEFKKAFTLAEVLIVIGIIGVVAALTLPNLNHATGDKERVTKVKKIYGALTEAFDRAQAIYGDFNTWYQDLSEDGDSATKAERFGKRVTEFMKISKDCGLLTNQGCFTSGYSLKLDSSNYNNFESYNDLYKVITADGMSIGFSSGNIFVDIDGPQKGPFMLGKDVFVFTTIDGKNMLFLPSGGPGGPYYYVRVGCITSTWIIENDNADYLKTDENGKCNDSDIILDWTTNTSCH